MIGTEPVARKLAPRRKETLKPASCTTTGAEVYHGAQLAPSRRPFYPHFVVFVFFRFTASLLPNKPMRSRGRFHRLQSCFAQKIPKTGSHASAAEWWVARWTHRPAAPVRCAGITGHLGRWDYPRRDGCTGKHAEREDHHSDNQLRRMAECRRPVGIVGCGRSFDHAWHHGTRRRVDEGMIDRTRTPEP